MYGWVSLSENARKLILEHVCPRESRKILDGLVVTKTIFIEEYQSKLSNLAVSLSKVTANLIGTTKNICALDSLTAEIPAYLYENVFGRSELTKKIENLHYKLNAPIRAMDELEHLILDKEDQIFDLFY